MRSERNSDTSIERHCVKGVGIFSSPEKLLKLKNKKFNSFRKSQKLTRFASALLPQEYIICKIC